MNKTGVIQHGTPWKALNSDQVKILDNAGYEILREVGFFIAEKMDAIVKEGTDLLKRK